MTELHQFVEEMINKLLDEHLEMIRNFDAVMKGKNLEERARIMGRFDEKLSMLSFLMDKDRELIMAECHKEKEGDCLQQSVEVTKKAGIDKSKILNNIDEILHDIDEVDAFFTR